ncbi:hypothetical protein RRG08_020779 [Elysia crispata]|uniref:Uncharacterized protein n=1 Tax=Elysia crispata TaxID=231223 RepID=A0AAE1D4N0_9GAST|nr:hypothetical protein RRG08_020779 [Elysia crispata]
MKTEERRDSTVFQVGALWRPRKSSQPRECLKLEHSTRTVYSVSSYSTQKGQSGDRDSLVGRNSVSSWSTQHKQSGARDSQDSVSGLSTQHRQSGARDSQDSVSSWSTQNGQS